MKKRNELNPSANFQNLDAGTSEKKVDYTPTWMMISLVNPAQMEGRKIVMMMNRIIEEKTPKNMKAWV